MNVQLRIHGSPALPTLIYLPGMHGDWTLVASFRAAVQGKVRFVEITYPRTTTWTLDDYATGIERQLQADGVTEGWLIGESFGSQPAWAMIRRVQQQQSSLRIRGLILAGGFVKHPWPWGAKLLQFVSRNMPGFLLQVVLETYAGYARFRHRHAPETRSEIKSFVTNRRHPDDSPAMERRYELIVQEDLRSTARNCALPVHQLAGLIDPIVPAPLVRRWLRQNCPGFKGAVTLLSADHNVLATAPKKSAALVLQWMGAAKRNG
jgi:pimeloyl-ACP methyl ester carboxylesterase